MKKALCLMLALLMCVLCACSSDEPEDTAEPSAEVTASPEASPDTELEVLSSGTGFLITQSRTESSVRYNYTVTALDGTVIESAACGMQPKVAAVAKDMIGIRFFTERGSWCRYYDLAAGKSSDSFYGAFWDNGRLVAYNDFEVGRCLVVQDIFDPDAYSYKLHIDSAAMELTVIAAVQSDDGKTLTVEYYLGRSGDRQTALLPLA